MDGAKGPGDKHWVPAARPKWAQELSRGYPQLDPQGIIGYSGAQLSNAPNSASLNDCKMKNI